MRRGADVREQTQGPAPDSKSSIVKAALDTVRSLNEKPLPQAFPYSEVRLLVEAAGAERGLRIFSPVLLGPVGSSTFEVGLADEPAAGVLFAVVLGRGWHFTLT